VTGGPFEKSQVRQVTKALSLKSLSREIAEYDIEYSYMYV
jgi:hypothetical protein